MPELLLLLALSVALMMCNALGLEDARWFEIRMAAGEIGTLRSECFLRVDTVKRIIPILKEYEMRPKKGAARD